MNPERWRQIEQVYYAVLERADAQRSAYLEQACATDVALRREVEALLAANADAGSFLATPAFEKEAQSLAANLPSLSVGQSLSHYRIQSHLGVGGMGEVWLAEDLLLERKVALKLLPFTQDITRLQRFVREAKAASSLNHPNIITIYETGDVVTPTGTLRFIATEYIEGVTLRQRLNYGRLTLTEALHIARQIGSALEAAHAAGIVHRDIKPENVMLRPDGLVKVLDFGLAKLSEPRKSERGTRNEEENNISEVHRSSPIVQTSTVPGMILGTPRYMSPEQARGKALDARTDIFSLGVALYEMLAGQPPFAGETTAEVFAALLDKEPEPLRQIAENLPAEVEHIVRRALQKERDDRYQTSREMVADLTQLTERLPHPQHTISLPITTNETARATNENAVARPTPSFLVRHRKTFVAGALTLTVALPGLYFLRHFWSRTLSGPPTVIPFAPYAGTKDHASFSPDGGQIAFVWDGGKTRSDGKRDLYIKLIGVGDPVQMTTSPEDESRPAWSPDSKHIAFLRNNTVFVIPSLPGGAERRLIESVNSFTWMPDSQSLIVATNWTKEIPGQLWLISAQTGERLKQLTNPSQPSNDDQPAVSPDGEQIAFFRSFGPTRREVFVMPVGGGELTQLTTDKRQIDGLTWTGDSREIVYASNRGSGMSLWRIAASGGTPEQIVAPGFHLVYPNIARQGNRLAYTDRYNDNNIYQYEGRGFAGRPTPDKFGEAVPFLSSTRDDHSQQISPDGEKIVFVSMRSGSEEIWMSKRDGTNLVQLTNIGGYPTGSPNWSYDSRWIAFDTRVDGNAEVYVISVEGGTLRNLTNAPSYEITPTWSHDGNWIYFNSNRSGSYEVWKQPVAGGAAIQLTQQGARNEPREAPDGKMVYYFKDNTAGLWSVPVTGGAEIVVPELKDIRNTRSWGVIEQGIFFLSKEDAPHQTIRFFNFANRRITPLLTVEKDPLFYQPGLTLSPNGRTLLRAQKDHSVTDIMLIENFH